MAMPCHMVTSLVSAVMSSWSTVWLCGHPLTLSCFSTTFNNYYLSTRHGVARGCFFTARYKCKARYISILVLPVPLSVRLSVTLGLRYRGRASRWHVLFRLYFRISSPTAAVKELLLFVILIRKW